MPSTITYSLPSSSRDQVATFTRHRRLGKHTVDEVQRQPALVCNVFWRKKYSIGAGVEIYNEADIRNYPCLNHTIAFCEGFLITDLYLSLYPFTVLFFNFIQQFTATSFFVLAIFDCINAWANLGNNKLTLDYLCTIFMRLGHREINDHTILQQQSLPKRSLVRERKWPKSLLPST